MIVRCDDIVKTFPVNRGAKGVVKAVDGVSLSIDKGQAYGLVGESGSGKTTIGKIVLGILKPDSGTVSVGTKKVQVVFQDPFNSLDPKMRVWDILAEGLILSKSLSKSDFLRKPDFDRRIASILDLVRLPKSALKKYPHQFSGGERQRIAIGRAVLTDPEFIVCDEPVSSLDVTIQLQVLRLRKDIQQKFGMTYLFISHDLRVVRFMCSKVAIMKEGRIVEEGDVRQIYSDPSNAYTRQLLNSIPHIVSEQKSNK